jgi:hypothetical protein
MALYETQLKKRPKAFNNTLHMVVSLAGVQASSQPESGGAHFSLASVFFFFFLHVSGRWSRRRGIPASHSP